MRSRIVTTDNAERRVSAVGSVVHFVVGASKLALRGLVVAVAMGVLFGLLIGVGGMLMGVETQRLYVIGGFSGWISSFVAMMFVFSQMRRNWQSRH